MAALDPASARGGGFDRSAALGRLATTTFDVLVIGGGITGAGVALDAASRGLATALVEAGDFASGTSSKSSKMVHGGIRYLQQREFRLVYENLAERQRLLQNAPHLVAPLPFLIPLFGRQGVVSKAVVRSYTTALWLYDVTGGLRIGARHRRISREEAARHLPGLRLDRLVAGFVYFDARADDARLTLDVLQTAALDHGAVVANYAPVTALRESGGRLAGAEVTPVDGPPLDVSARAVVNATGVWAGGVAGLDPAGDPPHLRPAKGVHVTVPAARLPADIAAVVPVPGDRRSIFVVPWPDSDLVYLGTTDTEYEGSLDDPACTPEDVDYLLGAVNQVTTADLTRADVTGVWAGLRPLLAPRSGQRIAERTADLSRRHTVAAASSGLVTVTGGKLTTYRKMAQDTVDEVLRVLGEPPRRCVTGRLPLHGSEGSSPARPATVLRGAGGPRRKGLRDHLTARYGSRWREVEAVGKERPALLEPVVEGLPYLGAEVVHAARREMARTVDDVLSRRTRARLQRAREAVEAAPAVARLLADELGWDEERTAAEVESFRSSVALELERAGVGSGSSVGSRTEQAGG